MHGSSTVLTLADFIVNTRYVHLPSVVVDKAKTHILDTFGAALAGAQAEETTRAREALSFGESGGVALCWASALKLSARNAALVNGIAAHAFELDDTGGCDHSGAVVLPAVMALLPMIDTVVSGQTLITSVVLGYDMGRRVLDAFGGYRPHNEAGWHSTGTCGVFGAAAAAAYLLALNPKQTASCLGLAASFASGIWAFVHDGAMSKRVHAGRAAEGGLLAALLARADITGPGKIFDNVWGGFLNTYGPDPTDVPALTRNLGQDWRIMNCAIKPYAACRDTHAAVDAIDRVMTRHSLHPSDIQSVEARLNTFLAGMVGARDVSTLPAAQMSLPFAASARICFGTVGLSSYSPEKRADPQLIKMIEKVSIEIDESVTRSDRSTITITTKQGQRIQEPTTTALGAPDNPLSNQAIRAKFQELANRVLLPEQTQRLEDAVLDLDNEADARNILTLLLTTKTTLV